MVQFFLFGLVFLPTPSFYWVFCFITHLQIELEIRYNTLQGKSYAQIYFYLKIILFCMTSYIILNINFSYILLLINGPNIWDEIT
jgi:hypothetical protein